MRVSKIYEWGVRELKKSGINNYRYEINWIIESEGVSLRDIIINPDKEIGFLKSLGIIRKILKRKKRYPLQYILGEEEFLGLKFKVNKNVLIPRPETEILVKEAIRLIGYDKRVLDIGCGSGAIGISLKYYRKDLDITMSDISRKALKVAKENVVSILKKSDGIRVIHSDLFSKIKDRFDVIISNPPYITKEEISLIDPELRFEPSRSLFCKNKTEFYEKILVEGLNHINRGGFFIFELGLGTDEHLKALFEEKKIMRENYVIERFIKDFNNINRVCIVKFISN